MGLGTKALMSSFELGLIFIVLVCNPQRPQLCFSILLHGRNKLSPRDACWQQDEEE